MGPTVQRKMTKKTLQIEKDGVRVQAPAGLQMSAAAAADGHSWAQHTVDTVGHSTL